ncbi:hypothetical protein [Leucobacter manosquensis]|uniref:Uncharacterized protein n=1 Tax=Leucobacter manosquensis TaxID=2810611 RepID=A0ABS5M8D9_9MICO|nr:hypothetical protein [Leucobacter manosquensis]MBS3183452.1 hypothetical protein [Leucobacter manosquensis]
MQSISTITTVVPVVDDTEIPRQLRKLAERDENLMSYAHSGSSLASIVAIAGPEFVTFVTFVDTLTRDPETIK